MNIDTQLQQEYVKMLTRRHFLKDCSTGIGAAAFMSLASSNNAANASPQELDLDTFNPLAAKTAHFAPTAKRVIYLHMCGSPPQLDLFDHKPILNKNNDKDAPEFMYKGNKQLAFTRGVPQLLGSPFKFKKHGQSGTEVSNIMPYLAKQVDKIAVIKSLHTEQFNHAPAQLFLQTGSAIPGRPSMGSWLTYGLGSEATDLPAFVALVSGGKVPSAGKSIWGSGFLPSIHQGVQCRSKGDPVLYVKNPKGLTRKDRRRSLDLIQELNKIQYQNVGDHETLTRIAQYEMAFKMQVSVPEVMDIKKEPQHIHDLYGTKPGQTSFANNCLLARRLLEKGTRFVQLYDWGWDVHGSNAAEDIRTHLPKKTKQTDQAIAALLQDLDQRGMLKDTLVVWGGEFGRTPTNEKRNGKTTYIGRDHHPHAFTMWMAGGGVKPGITYGETDEFGYNVTKDKMHVHDLQATILHTLGINHEKLTYRFQGRDYRLTDIAGHVHKDLLL